MTQFFAVRRNTVLATAATVKVAVDSVQWLNTSLGEGCIPVTSVNVVNLPLNFIQYVYVFMFHGIIDMAKL